jgi:predicted homoserine dehydrogenase-like protein
MLLPELKELDASGNPLRVGLVGAGQMGEGLVAQMESAPGMDVYVVADVVPGRSIEVFRNANVPDADVVETDDPATAAEAVAGGRRVATTNPALAWTEPVDVTIEATGVPEVGARVAYGAILAGNHVLQMNVETDATVGYLLRRLARSAGVVYSLTSGDEPGATTELWDFASTLGFDIVCVGKGKNNPLDRTANPDTMAERAGQQQMNPKMLASFVDGTKTMVEMTSLANAVGFVPDVPGAHGPEATRDNLAEVFVPEKDGGILSQTGVVEYARGIAPGVFVVFTTEHPKLVRDLQYLAMGPGPYWSLYRPYHLTSLETPFTIARMALWGETISATDRPPTAESVAVAKKDLKEGETIDGLGGFCVYGFIETADAARDARMLPLGLAPGSVITRDVPSGQPVTYDDVELDESLTIVHLRRLQDLELAG